MVDMQQRSSSVSIFSDLQLSAEVNTVCGYKPALDTYLAGLEPSSPVHNLEELIKWNEDHAEKELPKGIGFPP